MLKDIIKKEIYRFISESEIHERIGSGNASVALSKTKDRVGEKRSDRIRKDAILSLLNKYMNKNLNFIIEFKDDSLVEFKLIDAYTEPARLGSSNEYMYDAELILIFKSDRGKEIRIKYHIFDDMYSGSDLMNTHMNRKLANVLVNIANLYRETFFKAYSDSIDMISKHENDFNMNPKSNISVYDFNLK